jgi:hypothetical protein
MASSRLEPSPRIVTWTESRSISVGYHRCPICDVETPEPSMTDLITFAMTRPNGGYLWPGAGQDGWIPPGWTQEHELGLICPGCTAVKNTALATRRKPK